MVSEHREKRPEAPVFIAGFPSTLASPKSGLRCPVKPVQKPQLRTGRRRDRTLFLLNPIPVALDTVESASATGVAGRRQG
jgi:hypothetical protein